MPLDDNLLRNEKILASAKAVSGGYLHATNQRVIKYDKGMLGEKVESLSYAHIVEASYEKKSLLGWLIAGIVCIFLGVILWQVLPEWLFGVWREILLWAEVGLGMVSITVFVVLTLLGKVPQFFQIKAVGLSDAERQSWRTAGADAAAQTFARFIQDQISTRETQTPQPQIRTDAAVTNQTPPLPSQSVAVEKAEVEKRRRPETIIASTEKPPANYCRYCGKENKFDAVFCKYCGKEISD